MADTEQEVKNGPPTSRSILAKPKLFDAACSTSSDAAKSNPFVKIGSGSVLRPPQLKPSNLTSNIFSRLPVDENITEKNNEENKKKETNKDEPSKEEAPKFVPLGASAVHRNTPLTVPTSSASSASVDFVFGQNLSSRVMGASSDQPSSSSVIPHASTNGNASDEPSGSELLFTAAASSIENKNPVGSVEVLPTEDSSHLQAPLPCTTPITGEEGEKNIMQISCRLFAWEGGWRERGRGVVRLNDLPTGGSRLLARACGSLRLLVNTKLWGEMTCEKPSPRCLRVTTNPTLMLFMGAPNDIGHLHKAMITRISALKLVEASLSANEQNERVNGGETDSDSPKPTSERNTSQDILPDEACDENSKPCVEEDENELNDSKESLKRKETEVHSDPSSPKRQCPKVIID